MDIALVSTLVPLGGIALGWIFKSLSSLKADHSGLSARMESMANDMSHIRQSLDKITDHLLRNAGISASASGD